MGGELNVRATVQFSAYTTDDCHGDVFDARYPGYGMNYSTQFKSYGLSRDLLEEEELDFMDVLPGGGALNTIYDGLQVTYSFVISMAEDNARNAGCHEMNEPMGCFRLWIPPLPSNSGIAVQTCTPGGIAEYLTSV